MTSLITRILKDNEIVNADLDDNTNGDDSEDESNEEEEDSDKIVDDPLYDFDTNRMNSNIL